MPAGLTTKASLTSGKLRAVSGTPLHYELLTQDGGARRGRVSTARGTFETPVFMPVGTRGALIHLDATDYERLGLEVVLGNTYHLMLRPGPDVIAELGGLHAFCGWDGHMLTDSGGFQVMSLGSNPNRDRSRKQASDQPGLQTSSQSTHNPRSVVDDDGVTFSSVYDGEQVRLTPELAVQIQRQIGADIQMVLDVCVMLPAPDDEVRLGMERTHEWAARALTAYRESRESKAVNKTGATSPAHSGQALFGIVQGGADVQLRQHSAETLAQMDFAGYGIGGLAVGESQSEMSAALCAATEILPANKPRYLMGVGDPLRLLEAIAAGVDMFDCVLPTRLARHGTALTSEGRLNLRNARFARDDTPLQASTPFGGRFSRAYLRHLLTVNEPTAARILTLHNLWFINDLVAGARQAIEDGRFIAYCEAVTPAWALTRV